MNLIKQIKNWLSQLWGRSIRRQLAITFSIASLLIALGGGLFVFSHQRNFLYTQGTARAVDLAQIISYSSWSKVLEEDMAGLEVVLNSVRQTEDFKFVLVMTPQGKVLSSTLKNSVELKAAEPVNLRLQTLPPERQMLANDANLIDVAVPIKAGKTHVGWVRAQFSREAANANLHVIAFVEAGIALVFLLLMIFIAHYLSLRLTKRLDHLVLVTGDAELGREFKRDGIEQMDEVGLLSQHLYRMLDTINEEKSLRLESEARYRFLFENNPFPMWVFDEHSLKFLMVNNRALTHYGYTRDEFSRMTIRDIRPAEGLTELGSKLASSAGKMTTLETIHQKKDGTLINVEVSVMPMEYGAVKARIAIIQDVTERKQSEMQRRILSTAIEQSPISVVITDAKANIEYVNPRFTEVTGYAVNEVLGKNPRILKSGKTPLDTYTKLWDRLVANQIWHGELHNRRKNGENYWEEAHIAPVKNDAGVVSHFVAAKVDISLRKSMEEEVQKLAFYDPLTKLPNRRLLIDRLSQALSSSKRNGSYGALMFLDLDNFKPLNDQHGHIVGDLLLVEAAERLQLCVREVDTVARLGGDEFVVLLSELPVDKATAMEQAEKVAEKIRATLAEPYILSVSHEGQTGVRVTHHCTVSIGVELFSRHAGSQDDLMERADAAMYQAKEAGRNLTRFYTGKT